MSRLIDYSSRFKILKGGKISLIVSALAGSISLSFAAPSGGVVTSGSASISQNGNTTNITQSTNKATINWNKFSISSGETVNFYQPNKNSVTLNRVIGNEKSIINGALNANGQVWLLNSNGVLFGSNAKINTAGLLTTTKTLSDEDFNKGNYTFTGESLESVINLGEITISDEGYTTLIAKDIKNEGTIKAVKGRVDLVGADEVTINLNGNSMTSLTVNKSVLDALIENKGAIYANNGEIYLTANSVNELMKSIVNNEGIIEASSLDDLGGEVKLAAYGGEVNNSGSINTSSQKSNGGNITIEADKILLTENTNINSSGHTAGGDIFIGGGWQGKDPYLYNAKDVQVDNGAKIDSSAKSIGDAGTIVFWSDEDMRFAGHIKATGGEISGDGGKVEVSGKERLWFLGTTELNSKNGKNGHLLLDPSTITIVDGSSGQTGSYSDWSNHSDGSSYVIPETVLEALTGDVVLTAVTDIIIEDLTDNELTLSADNMYFYSNDESSGSSSGGFVMRDINDTIFLNKGAGYELVLQGGNISNLGGLGNPASIYVGNILTSGANVVFNSKRSGAASDMYIKGTINTNGGDLVIEPGTRFGLTNTSDFNAVFEKDINVGSGTIKFNFTGSGKIESGSDLTLTANNFILNNNGFDGNNSNIVIKPYKADMDIDFGTGGNGDIVFTTSLLNQFSNFNTITIGRTDGTGTITVLKDTSLDSNKLIVINKTLDKRNAELTNTGTVEFRVDNLLTKESDRKLNILVSTSRNPGSIAVYPDLTTGTFTATVPPFESSLLKLPKISSVKTLAFNESNSIADLTNLANTLADSFSVNSSSLTNTILPNLNTASISSQGITSALQNVVQAANNKVLAQQVVSSTIQNTAIQNSTSLSAVNTIKDSGVTVNSFNTNVTSKLTTQQKNNIAQNLVNAVSSVLNTNTQNKSQIITRAQGPEEVSGSIGSVSASASSVSAAGVSAGITSVASQVVSEQVIKNANTIIQTSTIGKSNSEVRAVTERKPSANFVETVASAVTNAVENSSNPSIQENSAAIQTSTKTNRIKGGGLDIAASTGARHGKGVGRTMGGISATTVARGATITPTTIVAVDTNSNNIKKKEQKNVATDSATAIANAVQSSSSPSTQKSSTKIQASVKTINSMPINNRRRGGGEEMAASTGGSTGGTGAAAAGGVTATTVAVGAAVVAATVIAIDSSANDANVGAGVKIGKGSTVNENNQIKQTVTIGQSVKIDTGARIGTETNLNNKVIINPQQNINENAKTGLNTTINNSVIQNQNIKVGSGVTIGKGTSISKNTTLTNGVAIGQGVSIDSGVSIGTETKLKQNVDIGSSNPIIQNSIKN